MNNYTYILASLPALSPDYSFGKETPADMVAFILEQLSEKDGKLVRTMQDGFDKEKLGKDFYRAVLTDRNRFLRDYFRFDLRVRNAKVAYLNERLGRAEGTDILAFDPDQEEDAAALKSLEGVEFEEEAATNQALAAPDLLSRERALDALYNNKIEALTTFEGFTLEAILGFLAKLHIVARWFELDEQTGREKFRALVDEVRGTYNGVEYK
ncbi:MAG: DUF2764 family protein [Bacteroidales bacterium]|nr:DUF2764 family protein [Bacteroidales bacterium]